MSDVYTFVMECAGHTRIAQVTADSPERAAILWARSVDWESLGATAEDVEGILSDLEEDDKPGPIDDVTNVWCTGLHVAEAFALVNIIKTAVD
jgi:hypothetical protein